MTTVLVVVVDMKKMQLYYHYNIVSHLFSDVISVCRILNRLNYWVRRSL